MKLRSSQKTELSPYYIRSLNSKQSVKLNKYMKHLKSVLFSTGEPKNGFVCSAGGNKMHFMTR